MSSRRCQNEQVMSGGDGLEPRSGPVLEDPGSDPEVDIVGNPSPEQRLF